MTPACPAVRRFAARREFVSAVSPDFRSSQAYPGLIDSFVHVSGLRMGCRTKIV
jgi:hypothetical protein